MSRVPDVPPKWPYDILEEVRQVIQPTTPKALREKRDFIRNELARIGNEVDQRKIKKPR
jgi:hypothetical protein